MNTRYNEYFNQVVGILMRRYIVVGGVACGLIVITPLCVVAGATLRQAAPFWGAKETIVSLSNTGVTLLDRNEQKFFTLYRASNIQYVPLSDIPPHLQQAVLDMEDRQFYSHYGFSPRGITRSVVANFRQKAIIAGGSTITQQLVKNTLLSQRKSFTRKYKEVVLAVALERKFSKNDILEMYLNTAYFGEGAVGIENAAQRFFGKSARELTLAESSLLTALLPSPSALAPRDGEDARAKSRQHIVLRVMRNQGHISEQAEADTAKERLAYRASETQTAPVGTHVALMVKKQLVQQFGDDELARSGYSITTTIDMGMQQQAEEIVRAQVEKLRWQEVSNGAAVAADPTTGEVLALVGSVDWYQPRFGKVNMAIAPRQTGSSFKPIVYATALEAGQITPASVLKDTPTTFGTNYRPQNYDRRWRGNVLVRQALANSLNIPAVHVMQAAGVKRVVAQAETMGITTLPADDYNLALALGAGEVSLLQMTSAYSTFANAGVRHEPRLILEIRDKFGKVIKKAEVEGERVLSEETSFMISSILSDNEARRQVFGNALTLSRPAAVKTGTTENYRDAWTIGYTPQLVVGAWVGNSDNTPMKKVAGAMGAAPIWRQLMETFSQSQPTMEFAAPASLVRLPVCRHNGLPLATFTSRSRTSSISTASTVNMNNTYRGYADYFKASTVPTQRCYGRLPSVSPSPTPDPATTPVILTKETEEKVKEKPKKEEEEEQEET